MSEEISMKEEALKIMESRLDTLYRLYDSIHYKLEFEIWKKQEPEHDKYLEALKENKYTASKLLMTYESDVREMQNELLKKGK